MTLNYFINLAKEQKQVIRLSLLYPKKNKFKIADNIKQILPLIEDGNKYIEIGMWKESEPKPYWKLLYKYPFLPTVKQWSFNKSGLICYQFDGQCRPGRQRFPSIEVEAKLLRWIKFCGYTSFRLGKHLSLSKCVDLLSQCELFVGVDSGMSCAAAAVGTPIIFCQNGVSSKQWETLHSNKCFILAKDYLEASKHISLYRDQGFEYYIKNAKNTKYLRQAKGE